jgi:hypothetical protein
MLWYMDSQTVQQAGYIEIMNIYLGRGGKMQNRWQLYVRQWNVSLEQKNESNYTE